MADDDLELVRYWFEFDVTGLGPTPALPGTVQLDGGTLAHRFCWRGVGVTGFDEDDCLAIIAEVLHPEPVPPIERSIRNIDVSTLALGERPVGNPIVPVWRGIWFPPESGSGPSLR